MGHGKLVFTCNFSDMPGKITFQIMVSKVVSEFIVTFGNRGVGSEDAKLTDSFIRKIIFLQKCQGSKSGMAFIEMICFKLFVTLDAQHFDPPEAQNRFLAETECPPAVV